MKTAHLFLTVLFFLAAAFGATDYSYRTGEGDSCVVVFEQSEKIVGNFCKEKGISSDIAGQAYENYFKPGGGAAYEQGPVENEATGFLGLKKQIFCYEQKVIFNGEKVCRVGERKKIILKEEANEKVWLFIIAVSFLIILVGSKLFLKLNRKMYLPGIFMFFWAGAGLIAAILICLFIAAFAPISKSLAAAIFILSPVIMAVAGLVCGFHVYKKTSALPVWHKFRRAETTISWLILFLSAILPLVFLEGKEKNFFIIAFFLVLSLTLVKGIADGIKVMKKKREKIGQK